MILFIAVCFIATVVMAYNIGQYENEHRSKDK
jgi:hypothetical protein